MSAVWWPEIKPVKTGPTGKTRNTMFGRQRSLAAQIRDNAAEYVPPEERKDCCRTCHYHDIRVKNARCTLHEIFINHMGTCPSHEVKRNEQD